MPPNAREAHLRDLAERLEFTLEKSGERFSLTRTSGVSRPVHEEGLTLERAEELLNEWKLRGPHGGWPESGAPAREPGPGHALSGLGETLSADQDRRLNRTRAAAPSRRRPSDWSDG